MDISRAIASSRHWAHTAVWVLLSALAAGCGGGSGEEQPPLPLSEKPQRDWSFSIYPSDGTYQVGTGNRGTQVGGILDKRDDFGGQVFGVQSSLGNKERAEGEVFSNESGKTYWVWAEAPQTDGRVGGIANLVQSQGYIKQAPNASLEMIVSSAFIEAIDSNSGDIFLSRACPWLADLGQDACTQTMIGHLLMSIVVIPVNAKNLDENYAEFLGELKLQGWAGHWRVEVPTVTRFRKDPALPSWSLRRDLAARIWNRSDFDFVPDVEGLGSQANARVKLKQPKTIKVNLSNVPIGQEFTVLVHVKAEVLNRRGRESYIAAYLRDPANTSGLGEITHVTAGLQPTDTPFAPPPVAAPAPAAPCANPNPAAGVLQFSAAAFSMPEWAGATSPIIVTRTGGSSGKVSATFSTSDGTAVAGADYTPANGTVTFGDGDAEPRVIDLEIVRDTVAELDKTIRLELSAPDGCATLGARATAELTILDDDRPLPTTSTYSVGGTVTGLVGTGLLLKEVRAGVQFSPATGSFVFGYPYPDSSAYEVRVVTQPTNPTQICNISNGAGTIVMANVTNVAVTCATPAPNGSLDPTFGTAGRVYAGDLDYGRAVGIQSSGRIVVLSDMVVAGYDALGNPDPAFGIGGKAPIRFNGGLGDEEAYGMTVQPDDKIIVVGRARVGTKFHMAVARLNADGTIDGGFGSAGLTTIDPYADLASLPNSNATSHNHYARKALIAPDGKIFVAGNAGFIDDAFEIRNNFAVAKLNADGSPDTSFGAGRGSTADVGGGGPDFAYGLGVQSDGMVVLAGSAASSTAALPTIGLARFKVNGLLDTGDPRLPEHYGRDGSGVSRIDGSLNGLSSVANDMVMLADNSVVVAATVSVPHPVLGYASQIRLAHVDSDGTVGGSSQIHATPIGPDTDYARALIRQADGKFVLVGKVSSSSTIADFGIVRYNADLTLDATFGTNGVVLVDFFGSLDDAAAVAIQPDGKIVVAGLARNGISSRFGMVRVMP